MGSKHLDELNREIAERRRVESFYKALLEAAPDAKVIIDDEGIIQLVNAQTEKLFGYRHNEIIGEKVEKLMPQRYEDIHHDHREDYFKKPKVRPMGEKGMELYGKRKDGTEFPVEISLSPLQTDDGLIVISSIRDITERKKAEAEIRQYNQELESKNRELKQFAYVASHDLQEPLSTVSSFVELLDKQYKDTLDEKGRTYLRFVKESSERMRNLVTALLEYSRLGRNKHLFKVDCNQVVRNVISDLDSSIKNKNAEIIANDLPILDAYPTELKILFQNLIGNAIKFVAPNTQPRVCISARKNQESWEFSVCDNGIGIEEKFKDKIFIIFQRLYNISEYEGTGIGLAQCKKITELHGGDIWVESELGKGSCFYFNIPVQSKTA